MKQTTFKVFNNIYRGIVVDNLDPDRIGRCRIFIPGIYPETFKNQPNLLPWAEPVMPLFGGSWKNDRPGSEYDLNKECGFCTIPHTSEIDIEDGAQVWVFFEGGDPNFPKYFAACQAGFNKGWLSEHRYQHVMKTPNVTIIIDEHPDDPLSSQHFDTNTNGLPESNNIHSKKDVSTRVDLRIRNKPGIALNIVIEGDVNLKVDGNVYEEITKNKHSYIKGNVYEKINGDVHRVIEGSVINEIKGKCVDKVDKDRLIETKKDVNEMIAGDKYESIMKNSYESIKGNKEIFIIKNYSIHTLKNYSLIAKNNIISTLEDFCVTSNRNFINSMNTGVFISQIGEIQIISQTNQLKLSGMMSKLSGGIVEIVGGAILNESGGPDIEHDNPSIKT